MTRGHMLRNIRRILDLNCCTDPERVAEEILIEFEVSIRETFLWDTEKDNVIPIDTK